MFIVSFLVFPLKTNGSNRSSLFDNGNLPLLFFRIFFSPLFLLIFLYQREKERREREESHSTPGDEQSERLLRRTFEPLSFFLEHKTLRERERERVDEQVNHLLLSQRVSSQTQLCAMASRERERENETRGREREESRK